MTPIRCLSSFSRAGAASPKSAEENEPNCTSAASKAKVCAWDQRAARDTAARETLLESNSVAGVRARWVSVENGKTAHP